MPPRSPPRRATHPVATSAIGVQGIRRIRHPYIGECLAGRFRRALYHSRDRARHHVIYQDITTDHVLGTEQDTRQLIGNNHVRQTGIEIGLRKRLAGKELEVKYFPKRRDRYNRQYIPRTIVYPEWR